MWDDPSREETVSDICTAKSLYGNTIYNSGSRFLEEIPQSLVDYIDLNDSNNDLSGLDFVSGERVFHEKWGSGMIIDVKGRL